MHHQLLVRFIGRRLASYVVVMVGVTMVAFALTQLVPADPASVNLGQRAAADPEIVAAFNHRYGLDQPVPVQYVKYIQNLARGDLGQSQLTQRPVLDDLRQFIPATMELTVMSLLVAVVLGLALGLVAAVRRGSWVDSLVRGGSLVGVAMPTFWLALVAFYLLVYKLGISPGSGRLDPGTIPPSEVTGFYTIDALLAGDLGLFFQALSHIWLPGLIIAAYSLGLLTRFSRAAILDVLDSDFVRTARAKGLPERTILTRHVLRAALVPILTVVGLTLASMLAGAVFTETIFSWSGLGQYAYRAATNVDLAAIMGVSLFIAVVYLTINLAVDVLYAVVDPRIRIQ
jgi:peptide/nickel transport system permease protein